MMKCAMGRTLPPVLVTIVLALPAAAQRDLTADEERALAALAVPARQWEASRTLVRAGTAALRRLQPVLRDHRERPATEVSMALLVAGRFGRDAAPLLDTVLEVYRMGLAPELRRQALWAVGQLAPFAPADVRGAAQTFLQDHFAADGDRFLFACVDERVALGPELQAGALRAVLLEERTPPARRIAIGEAIAAARAAEIDGLRGLGELLHELLARRLERPLRPWDVDTSRECEVAPLAAAAWNLGVRTPTVARGLVQHWDPELRLAALDVLANGAALSRTERWDVVMLLWDAAPMVRDVALATMRGWADGLAIAMPAVAGLARSADPALAAAATRAVERWGAEAPPATSAALRVLRGESGPAPVGPAGAHDRALLAELVLGCRGSTGGELLRLAPFVREHGLASPDVVDAFLWCTVASDEARAQALRALVAVGPVVAAVRPDVATELLRSAAVCPGDLREIGPLAEAWIRAGPAAADAELAAAIAGDHWCAAARGLAEAVRRGASGAWLADAALAARDRPFADVFVAQGEDWSRRRGRSGHSWVTKKADPELVAALATLVLLAAGDERWRDEPGLGVCLRRLGEGATAASLFGAKARGELRDLAGRLEAPLRPRWLGANDR